MTDKTVSAWRNPRPIVERIEVRGDLVLLAPAHFGTGDPDPLSNVDMVLLRDPLTGQALLPGASIAGALRNYMREVELGFNAKPRMKEERNSWAVTLLGGSPQDDEGTQSLLLIDDALADISAVELRDGVKIEISTGTAAEGAKFDIELLPAGTVFGLYFELLIPAGRSDELRRLLGLALHGLEEGEIVLGARKRRGFGRCRVASWTVDRYKLTEPEGLIAWLQRAPSPQREQDSSVEALQVNLDELQDARHDFQIEATFQLDGSVLVRSGFGEADTGPDTVHLHSAQADGRTMPVLPGSSLAGVLRHRALRIANTLRPGRGSAVINRMFGSDEKGILTTSRLTVQESIVIGGDSLVQTRVKIDRFTGGAYETALFEEQPLFGRDRTAITLELALRNPEPFEIGLLLLLLKDLWTGDLPVGGESSVGR
jgi:CRISPR/Cas system CMR subunit Cmr4 (Cas7 group RAMP superfamily)